MKPSKSQIKSGFSELDEDLSSQDRVRRSFQGCCCSAETVSEEMVSWLRRLLVAVVASGSLRALPSAPALLLSRLALALQRSHFVRWRSSSARARLRIHRTSGCLTYRSRIRCVRSTLTISRSIAGRFSNPLHSLVASATLTYLLTKILERVLDRSRAFWQPFRRTFFRRWTHNHSHSHSRSCTSTRGQSSPASFTSQLHVVQFRRLRRHLSPLMLRSVTVTSSA